MSTSFTARFEAAWADPTPQGLAALLHEDVVLKQPHLPPLRGKAAVVHEFERLFRLVPGTHSVVKHHLENATEAYIEHELRFPAARGVVRVPAIDRFILEDGLAKERVVYFDQMRLISGILRHPSLWRGFLRYKLGS